MRKSVVKLNTSFPPFPRFHVTPSHQASLLDWHRGVEGAEVTLQGFYIGQPWLLLTEKLYSPIASTLAPTVSIGNSKGKIIRVVNVNIYLKSAFQNVLF